MEGHFVRVSCTLQSVRGGRTYSKNALANTTADKTFIHSSRFTGEVRVYNTLEELARDCDFKDALGMLSGCCAGSPSAIVVAEDVKQDRWCVLWRPEDLLPSEVTLCYEIVEDEKRRRAGLLRSLFVPGLTVEDKVMAFGAIAKSHATEKKAKEWLTDSRK